MSDHQKPLHELSPWEIQNRRFGGSGWRVPKEGRDRWRAAHYFTSHATDAAEQTACGRKTLHAGEVPCGGNICCLTCQAALRKRAARVETHRLGRRES